MKKLTGNKLMALLLAVMMVVMMGACGSSSAASQAPSSSSVPQADSEPASVAEEESSEEQQQAQEEEGEQEVPQVPFEDLYLEDEEVPASDSPGTEEGKAIVEEQQSGPSEESVSTGSASGSYVALVPKASGEVVYTGGSAEIDASNTSEGYVMVRYSGSNNKIRVQVTKDGGTPYTYALDNDGEFDVLPFSQGSGGYTVNILENVGGNRYSLELGQHLNVQLRSSTLPFLYPNQYVNFWPGCKTAELGAQLAAGAPDELTVVANIYNWVIKNISYDFYKAENSSFGYLPNVDTIISTKKGICFDYGAVMAAMLRTQGIPTRLDVGYAGSIYHAWISVYLREVGWVNGIIYFDGQTWKRMDPTFASSGNSSSDIMAYIGNGANYNTMYVY